MRKLLLVALLSLAPALLHAQDMGMAIGKRAPAIKLQDINGRTVDLGRYIGKQPVLLEFWATWCPLCRALEPQLTSIQRRYGRRLQTIIVAVGVNQNPSSIKRHLAKHAMPGIVVWDGDGVAVRAFEAPGTSYIVVLDRNGRVVYTGSGSDQKLTPVVSKL